MFVKVQLADRQVATELKPIPVWYEKMVLVCTHGSRDKRCGRVGPQVLQTSTFTSVFVQNADELLYQSLLRHGGSCNRLSVQYPISPLLNPVWKFMLTISVLMYTPQAVSEMHKELRSRGVHESEVAVRGCSHIGGHKYAGVLIIYPQGDW